MPVLLVKGNNSHMLERVLKKIGYRSALRELRYVSKADITAARYIGPSALTESQLTLVEQVFGNDYLGMFSGTINEALDHVRDGENELNRALHDALVSA